MTYGNYPDLQKVKRILVVKMRHHGDVLLTSPVFSHLKKAIPQAKLDAFIYADTLPMLEGHPAIDDFLLYDRKWKKLPFFKKLAKEVSTYRHIRSKKYDLVINLTEGDRGAIVALLSGATYSIGFDPGKSGLWRKKGVFTYLVKNCPHPRHTVERQLDVLRRLGLFPKVEERDLFLHVPVAAAQNIKKVLAAHQTEVGQYIVIHPVSRWRFKCLSTQQIAQLILCLHERGERIVLSSGPDVQEVEMIQEILAQIPQIPVINLAAQMTLKELSALISFAKMLICVDSVPLHIASAVKTPVVALFGPTSELNWGPWMHPEARVVTQNLPCRPCYQDGCGGSKMSDCLFTLPGEKILDAVDSLGLAAAPAVAQPEHLSLSISS